MSHVNDIDNFIDRLQAGLNRLNDNDDILANRFLENLKVLEENFPSVYDVVKDYTPENKNVFMEQDGALNIFFPETKYTLFSDAPFEQIDKRYREFREFPTRTNVDIGESRTGNSLHEIYMEKIVRKKRHHKEKFSTYKELPDVLGSIILFGFDLGYQLVRILDEHYIKHIYLYEEDMDLFYYSLFAIDWKWVVDEMINRDTTLHFFIGIDEKEFFSSYTTNIRYNGIYMAAHTYLYMGYDKKVVDEFSNQYLRLIMGWGFFDDAVIGISQYLSRKNKTFLALDPYYRKQVRFNKDIDFPVLILGNGPSLDENIEYIKSVADKVVIFCCGTTLNTLYKYNIKPDFHVDVERMRHTAEKLEFIDKEFLSDIVALTVNVMHPEFYDYFDKSIIGMKPGEAISSIMKVSDSLVSEDNRKRLSMMHYSAPIVANLAMSYVLKMGFSEAYLIGVDCGFKDPTAHHSRKSGYYKDDGENTGLAEYKSGLIVRDANFGGYAYTTGIMDTSRVQLELAIKMAKEDNKLFQCYNLSTGVKIKGSEAIVSEDVLPFENREGNKNRLKDYIFEHLVGVENDKYGSREIGAVYENFRNFSLKCAEILKAGFNNKSEMLLMLSRYNELIMKQYFNGTPYNNELMSGSFIYFANELVDLVLSSPDDTIEYAHDLVEIFLEFIGEMPKYLEDPKSYVDPGKGWLEGRYNV